MDLQLRIEKENLRRIAEIAKLLVEAGNIVLSAFISPLKEDREMIKNIIGEADFKEVYVATDIATCEERDVKRLYAKARNGEIKNFTGISAPYEAPVLPGIAIKTESRTVNECVSELKAYVLPLIEVKIHDIEPYFNLNNTHTAEDDPNSPFYGRGVFRVFVFSDTIYNHYVHPQWDFFGPCFGSEITFVDYDEAIV